MGANSDGERMLTPSQLRRAERRIDTYRDPPKFENSPPFIGPVFPICGACVEWEDSDAQGWCPAMRVHRGPDQPASVDGERPGQLCRKFWEAR